MIPGSVFDIPPDTDFRPGTPLFNQVQAALIGGFAPPFKTFQFAAVAGLIWNDPTELVTAALNVIGFNLRYTPNVLEHTHGHIPFDNRRRSTPVRSTTARSTWGSSGGRAIPTR